jgi:hypothetical protein
LSARAEEKSVFGQGTQSEAALIGVLYDLKQTQDHKPTGVDPNTYSEVVGDYIAKGWDEAVLDVYYRVSKPIYTTQIFVPNMPANAAPRAFGAQKTVKPSRWIIHYRGQVSPPSPGVYRFWGCADDALAVAVDGKTELVACRPDMKMPQVTWRSSEPPGSQAADDKLIAGDWIDLKAGQIIDLDVIIGERPGGEFNAFLMIEKQGESYALDASGHPILPIFQVAAYDTPVIDNLKTEPRFAQGAPIWKSYQ